MKKTLLFVLMCVCATVSAWAETVTDLYNWSNQKVGTLTVDGSSAILNFSVQNADLNQNAQNALANLEDVKVTGYYPQINIFNVSQYQNGLKSCQRMDLSGITNFPNNFSIDQNGSVTSLILPSDATFGNISTGSGVKYLIKNNTGDSESNAVKVWVKNDTNNDWANDPYVQAADYVKAYTDNSEQTYLTGDVITTMQVTKWVNGGGKVYTPADFTLDANDKNAAAEKAALDAFLADHRIQKCTITGELDDLSLLSGVKVQTLDLSGVTNTDIAGLKLPEITDDTQDIKLPNDITYSSAGALSSTSSTSLTNLDAAIKTLKESGKTATSVSFPGGSTYSDNELTISNADKNNIAQINKVIKDGGLTVNKINVGESLVYENGELTLSDATIASDLCSLINENNLNVTKITFPNGSVWQNGNLTVDADDNTAEGLTAIKTLLESVGKQLGDITFPSGTTYSGGMVNVSNDDKNEQIVAGTYTQLKVIHDNLNALGLPIETVRFDNGTRWNSDGTLTYKDPTPDPDKTKIKSILESADFNVTTTTSSKIPDLEYSVSDDGKTVTIKSYKEGALFDILNANDGPGPEGEKYAYAQQMKQAIQAISGAYTLVLEGPFGAKDNNNEKKDLAKFTSVVGTNASTVDMRKATFSNPNDAIFSYWGNNLKTAYMSNDPKVTTITAQCFENMGNIENLYIGESVTEVPEYRFSAHTTLKHVSIPSSVVTIGLGAFQGCKNLSDIDWGNNCHVETIEASAFERTNISGTFVVPNSVKTIGDQAFKDNNNLKTLIFTEYSQIQSIGHEAFAQAQSSDGKLSDVYVNVSRMVECANQAFDKYHTVGQTQVGTVMTRLHYPREFYEYYVGSYKETLYDPNLDQTVNGEVVHAYGVITQRILDEAFLRAANGWQEFMSSGIPIGNNSLYRTYSESVSYLAPQKGVLEVFLVDNYKKDENLAYCVQMEPGDLIPANTGFIIHSTTVSTVYLPYSKAVADPYNNEDFPNNVYKKGGVGDGYNNYMKPINGSMHIDNVEIVNGTKTYRNYFFNNGTTAANRKNPNEWKDDYAVLGWGFFRAVSDDYTVWNKAFLHLPASMTDKDSAVLNDSGVLPQDQGGTQNPGGAKSFGLYIIGADDDAVNYGITTSLNTASEVERNETGFYTLQGVKVNAPTAKGLYIHNGKKVLVK